MAKILDSPEINDNRDYNYQNFSTTDRAEYPIIVGMIAKNSKVIDLACGNGSLLEKLIKEKNVIGQGIEISKSAVEICKAKGLNISEGRIDAPLPFEDNAFDYAICNVTIQMVMYPEVLVQEMKRIARYQIISFPNFAYYPNRLELLRYGRMPQTTLFGYQWYSTGHIHQLSIVDFLNICKKLNLKVVETIPIYQSKNRAIKFLQNQFSNFFSIENIFLVQK